MTVRLFSRERPGLALIVRHLQCRVPSCNTCVLGPFAIVVILSDWESLFSHFCYGCGGLIVRSGLGNVVNQAIAHHFSGNCALFQLL
jgi:hypothetical protein